jgi:hypothetical protein
MNWNREPGCEREAKWVETLLDVIRVSDTPVGTQVPRVITDPNFGDGQWIKMQATGESIEWHDHSKGEVRVYTYNVHYMFNVATRQVFQVKLKNSFDAGCVGKVKPK